MAKMQINLTNTNSEKSVSAFNPGEVVLIRVGDVTSAYMVTNETAACGYLLCLQSGKLTFLPKGLRGKPTKATLELEADLG